MPSTMAPRRKEAREEGTPLSTPGARPVDTATTTSISTSPKMIGLTSSSERRCSAMSVTAAGQAGQRARHGEDLQLVPRGVHAGDAGRHFAAVHGSHRATCAGVYD